MKNHGQLFARVIEIHGKCSLWRLTSFFFLSSGSHFGRVRKWNDFWSLLGRLKIGENRTLKRQGLERSLWSWKPRFGSVRYGSYFFRFMPVRVHAGSGSCRFMPFPFPNGSGSFRFRFMPVHVISGSCWFWFVPVPSFPKFYLLYSSLGAKFYFHTSIPKTLSFSYRKIWPMIRGLENEEKTMEPSNRA